MREIISNVIIISSGGHSSQTRKYVKYDKLKSVFKSHKKWTYVRLIWILQNINRPNKNKIKCLIKYYYIVL